VPSVAHLGPTHLGLDVHKDTISVAILTPDRDRSDVDRIAHDEAPVRRLVGRVGDPRRLRACHEAGPHTTARSASTAATDNSRRRHETTS
jgi:hypothetical protein